MKAKKKYEGGGVFPPAIKKLKERAAKKKAEKAKPSYRSKLDEVTVTAKAPTEAEKRGAKAFVNTDSVNRAATYNSASGTNGGDNLKDDTAKRLSVPKSANVYNSKVVNKKWKEALTKAGYRK